jgi:ketol-acid reductoisomerase
MAQTRTKIYFQGDVDPSLLAHMQVAVIGYGNQGRAQALNLRDSGVQVLIGNREDAYRIRAEKDGFTSLGIPDAVRSADAVFLLLPDEVLPPAFEGEIMPALQQGSTLVFASGYSVAFGLIDLPEDADALLIAPRMIGVGVRERYLTGEGFYCLVDVHQDYSGQAQEKMLALTWGIGKFYKPAIEVTFKQEAILDLFNEQAFGPAFGRVLLTAISVLLKNGLPPEAVLVEMYQSEEMAYTYQQMAKTGLVRQTFFHSPTSQYGAMSRGVRFLDLDLKPRMERIYHEIESGAFASEWGSAFAKVRFRVIRFFAMRQKINRIERKVRQSLGLAELEDHQPAPGVGNILNDPAIQAELEDFEETFEF